MTAEQILAKIIEDGLVDVVVVYKIDRLTRSLADFAKLDEIFPGPGGEARQIDTLVAGGVFHLRPGVTAATG